MAENEEAADAELANKDRGFAMYFAMLSSKAPIDTVLLEDLGLLIRDASDSVGEGASDGGGGRMGVGRTEVCERISGGSRGDSGDGVGSRGGVLGRRR